MEMPREIMWKWGFAKFQEKFRWELSISLVIKVRERKSLLRAPVGQVRAKH